MVARLQIWLEKIDGGHQDKSARRALGFLQKSTNAILLKKKKIYYYTHKELVCVFSVSVLSHCATLNSLRASEAGFCIIKSGVTAIYSQAFEKY